ncbi:hypothetical protein L9F63_011242, partial [Diploptera punctata]
SILRFQNSFYRLNILRFTHRPIEGTIMKMAGIEDRRALCFRLSCSSFYPPSGPSIRKWYSDFTIRVD